jgi:hypothetical protein
MPVPWKSWLRFLLALGFVAVGAWMLADRLRDPLGGKAGQVWSGLAIVVMFAGCAAIFAHELATGRRRGRRTGGGPQPGEANAGPLVAVYSTVWTAIALAGCLAFAGAGIMLLLASLAGGAHGIGWSGFIVGPPTAAVFGGFAIAGAAQLRRAGWSARHIRIDADGLYDSRIGLTIGWGDILWIAGRSIYGQRVIEVGLADAGRHLARLDRAQRVLARLNRAFGFAPYAITLAGLSAGEAEILAAIERFRAPQPADAVRRSTDKKPAITPS